MEVFDGEKGAGIKKFLRPPYIFFIIAGLVLGLYMFIKSRNSSSSDGYTLPSAYTTGGSSGGTDTTENGITAEEFTAFQNSLTDTLNEMTDAQIESDTNLLQNLTEYKQTVAGQISTISGQVTTANNTAISAMQQLNPQEDTTTTQINAAKNIKSLQDTWAYNSKQFNSDGVITPQEQSVLNDLHTQAETIGINAGFGIGGVDGAGRVIPDEIKKAAGI